MKVTKSLIWFLGCERDEIACFAFYLSLKQLSHEGAIHNFKSIQGHLQKRINISNSQFRKLLNECIEKGYFWIEGKHLRVKSQQKIYNDLKSKYPSFFKNLGYRKSYLTTTTNYKRLKYWLQSCIIHNIGVQLEYNKLTKDERKNKAQQKQSAPEQYKFAISKRKLGFHLNKSKSSAGYLVKKLLRLNLIDNEERFTTMLQAMTWLEYKFSKYFENTQFYLKNGHLWRNEANLLTIPNSPYYDRKNKEML